MSGQTREDLFGELRGLLALPSWDDTHRARLWSVLQDAHALAPTRYEHEVLPYLLTKAGRAALLGSPYLHESIKQPWRETS